MIAAFVPLAASCLVASGWMNVVLSAWLRPPFVCYSSLLSHAGALGKVGLTFRAGYREGFEPNAFPPPLVRQPRATACVNSGLSGFVTGLVNWPGVVNCVWAGQGETTTAALRET